MRKYVKSFLFIAVLFISFMETNGQCVFHKLYRCSSLVDDFGDAIIQLNDGGFLTVGNTTISQGDAVFIVRINDCGDTIWQKAYNLNTIGGCPGLSVIQTLNGNFVISGLRYDIEENNSDSYLLMLNNNGDSIWCKNIEGGYKDSGEMLKQTNDGGFIIGGYNYNLTFTNSQVFLIKTDSLGNVKWQQEYGDTGYDYLTSIDLTFDGGYIIGGEFENPATNSYDLFLLKTDSLGNQQWKKSYGGNYSDRKGYAIATSDSGYAIVGYTTYANGNVDGYIVKTDSLGTIQWEKKYGNASTIDVLINVRQLHDNTYIISGGIPDISVNPPRPRVWLLKTDPNGDTLWTKTYTYYGHSSPTERRMIKKK